MSATVNRPVTERRPLCHHLPAQRLYHPGARLNAGQLTRPESLAFLKTIATRYRQCFPEDDFWQALPVPDASEETLMDMATTFLETVDSRLFPVHTEIFIDELAEAWLYIDGQIPVYATGLSYDSLSWDLNLGGSTYPDLYILLLALAYRPYMPDVGQALNERYPQWSFPQGLDLAAIRPVLAEMNLPLPLSHLPEAISLCAKLSDNPFIYISPEDMGELPEWEDEAVAQLTEWWQEANPIFDAAATLAKWVDKDSENRLDEIVCLLLEAHQIVSLPA